LDNELAEIYAQAQPAYKNKSELRAANVSSTNLWENVKITYKNNINQ
jgi:hypothetical protein